jgi:DNA polymerase III subunit beta
MKFVISTQEFNYLINKCLNVVGAKATIPILSNLLIEAANDELVITATDLTVGIRCFTEAKIIEEGATTVPAKRLASLVRELTSTNIEISTNANEITEIVADSSRFKLHGMNRSEFPSLPNMASAVQAKIPQKELKEMLFRTAFAVSRDDNRYVLTGVYMQVANREVSFIGTDGKRLARSKAPLEIDTSFSGGYIIPLKAVEEIIKNLGDEGDANLFLLNDKIGLESSSAMVITKLLAGDYPDVSRVIPENSATVVSLHRDELMALLRQMALFTADSNHSVRFAFSDGELRLSANAKEVGEGRVSMPVNYHGQKMEIAFNPSFFLDILRHTKEETVTMGVTDAFNPGVITDMMQPPNSPSVANSLFVLMPMRIEE